MSRRNSWDDISNEKAKRAKRRTAKKQHEDDPRDKSSRGSKRGRHRDWMDYHDDDDWSDDEYSSSDEITNRRKTE